MLELSTPPAALPLWNRLRTQDPTARALSLFLPATVASQVLGIVRGVALAALLGPPEFGLWLVIKLILTYLSQVPVADLHVLRHDLPVTGGAERHTAAVKLVRTLFTGHLLMVCGTAALCAAVLSVAPTWRQTLPDRAWISIVAIALMQVIYNCSLARFQIEGGVVRYSSTTVIFSLLSTVAVLLGAAACGLPGTLGGLALAYAVTLGSLAEQRGLIVPIPIDWERLKAIWSEAIPVWMSSAPAMLLADIDQWLVLTWLGTQMLGVYGLALFLGSLLHALPAIDRAVHQPLLLRRLRETPHWQGLGRWFHDMLLLTAYVSPIPIAVLFILVDPLIAVALPAYQSGAAAAKIYILGSFWGMLIPLTSMVCLAMKRHRQWLRQTLVAIAAHVALTSFLLRQGGSVLEVAACMGIVFFVYASDQIRLTASCVDLLSDLWPTLLTRVTFPFLTTLVMLGSLDVLFPKPTGTAILLLISTLRFVIAVAFFSWQFFAADKRWGFTKVLTDLMKTAPYAETTTSRITH